MTQQQPVNTSRAQDVDGVPPPPRFLLWLVVTLFILLVIGGIGGLILLQNRPAPSEILAFAVRFAPIVTTGCIIAAAVFRRRLPRRFVLWLVIGLTLIWLVGGAAFILIYRSSLAPGQRETVKNSLPFMALFDPPLPPADTSLPTPIPNQGGISPQDLLNAPLSLGTPEPTVVPTQAVEVQPSANPTSQATVTPTPSPTAAEGESTQAALAPTEVPNLTIDSAPVLQRPAAARLYGFTVIKQTWNNCGPANVTMALSYYGWQEDQEYAASVLKPDREDKNVNPWELVSFINDESGVRALTRIGGDMELLKQFLAHDLPVIIETGYMPEGYDWIGHYQTVVGYDDSLDVFYVYDSYLGTGENGSGLPTRYEVFDNFWSHFNRTFVVLYTQENENLVRNILGERADITRAAEMAAETAQAEATANPQNGFAWFNLGSSLTRLERYAEAATAYEQATRVGVPWRMTLYQFGIFETYFNLGRYSDVIALVNANLNNGGEYVEETYYWQGKVLAAQGQTTEAAASFRRALQHNPRFTLAQDALNALPT